MENPNPPSPPRAHAPPPKLRLLCSYNGHILPRPHDKTLTYMGGETRLITLDKTTPTLQTLIHKILKTTSFDTTNPFLIKYQLPTEDLDTLVSVSTDEDVEVMVEEYFLFSGLSSESRLRLFLFPRNSDSEFVESVKSIGSVLLEGSGKSEEVYVRGLNGRLRSFCSNNSLLGLDDDVIKAKSDVVNNGEVKEKVQDVQSVRPESPEFGSVPDSPVVVKEEVNCAPVVVETVKEVVNCVAVQDPVKVVKEEVNYVAVQAPVVEAKVVTANGLGHRVSSGFDMASPDSVLSDGSLTNPLSRRNPPVIYQDAATQTQYSNNNSNGVANDQNAGIQMQQQQIHAATQTQYPNNNINGVMDDQNTRFQMQQQQFHDSAYLRSTSPVAVTTTTQTDLQHPQAYQQHQFIPTTDPSSVNDQNTRIHLQEQQIHDSAYLTSTSATSTTAAAKIDLQHPQVHQQHQFVHTTDPSSVNDQNTRIYQQQQQIHDPAYLTSTAATSTTAAAKADPQHPQMHQQHQFIHAAVPPPQYYHHHPSGAVPMVQYYPIYPPQSQHHLQAPALDQRNIVYYMPVIAAPPNNQEPTPSSLFTTPQTVQPASKPESPLYRTNSSGSSGPQLAQVPSGQHQPQPQPQFVAYPHIQQQAQGVASSGGIEPSSKPESPVYRTNSSGASGPQFSQVPSGLHQHQPQPQFVTYSHIQQPSQAVASSGGIETSSKPESPVYRTNSSGASGPQFFQVPSSQHQHQPQLQPQFVAYSHIQQPSQAVASSGGSGGNYNYEFADLLQQGRIYYAAQPMPPQSSAQYQTMSSNLPVEGGSHIQTESSMNQVKTSQP